MLQRIKEQQNQVAYRLLLRFMLIVLVLSSVSCRLQLLPAYDEKMIDAIEQTARKVDLLYILLLDQDAADSNGRQYAQWMDVYAGIEADLGLLQLKSAGKPLNQHSERICKLTLETWQKYKQQHKKDGNISDETITLNRMYMSEFFHAMLVAEKAKEMANSTSEKNNSP
jgi:hypothetical protein